MNQYLNHATPEKVSLDTTHLKNTETLQLTMSCVKLVHHNSPDWLLEIQIFSASLGVIRAYGARFLVLSHHNEVPIVGDSPKWIHAMRYGHDSAPATCKVLLQLRHPGAVLQGRDIWCSVSSSVLPYCQISSPADLGRIFCPEQWKPLWIHLPEARL